MSQLQVNRINDSSGGVLAPISSVMRNRIINGAMVIDQRNAGASVTPVNEQYVLDRWNNILTAASKFSIQQNAGSITPPVGFTNYLGATSLSAYSITSGDAFAIQHLIEGYNISDLGFGTANARTVTLSFQVYSSLTGTFGGSLSNSAFNRSYPFTYSIPTANTWTTISVTIAGDTSGTWLTTNGLGVRVLFSLGSGATFSGTAGSWSGSSLFSATGATSVVGTNGATFYITGVQLEVGTQATGFEYRQYGTELSLCKRYHEVFNNSSIGVSFVASLNTGTQNGINPTYTTKRAVPTFGLVAGSSYATGTPTIFSLGVDNSYIYLTTGWWYITGPVNTPSCFFSAEL